MTKEEHKKLADFFHASYLAEKEKSEPDEFLVRYFQDMSYFHARS